VAMATFRRARQGAVLQGQGLRDLNFTGMKGRVAIYEVMPVSEEIRAAILKNVSTPTRGRSPIARHEEPAAERPHEGSLKELRRSRKCCGTLS